MSKILKTFVRSNTTIPIPLAYLTEVLNII